MIRIDFLRRSRRLALGLLCGSMLTALGSAFGQDTTAPLLPFRGIRPLGMGNAYEAVANDLDSFDYNPAGLAQIHGLAIRIVPAQARLTKDFVDRADSLSDVLNEISNLSNQSEAEILRSDAADRLVQELKAIRRDNLTAQTNLGVVNAAFGLPTIGTIKPTIGASVSNQLITGIGLERAGLAWSSEILDILDDEFTLDGSIELLTTQFAVAGETTVPAMPFVDNVRFGVGTRFVRRQYKNDRFTLADLLSPEKFKREHFDATVEDGEIDSLGDVREIIDNNTTKESGFGLDVGVQIDHTDYLSSALVIRSLVSSLGDSEFPTTTTLSLAARPLEFLGVG
ncbi:MAG: conjugal transfer protein TraF, partial [Candidatus Poribacteria bacterium]|nr:conjugal transfer protein TraF [Candidatus Poribacteria bacterium]